MDYTHSMFRENMEGRGTKTFKGPGEDTNGVGR